MNDVSCVWSVLSKEDRAEKMNKAKKGSEEKKNLQNRKRVAKFREKMTQADLEEKRRKDRERYRKKKEQGQVKSIKDCTEKEKRSKREKWRCATRDYRKKKQMHSETLELLDSNTPPSTPPPEDDLIRVNVDQLAGHSRRTSGRKKVRRDRAQAYRRLKKAETQISKLRKDVGKYKKRLYRLSTLKTTTKMTPNSKVKNMTRGHKIPEAIKKRLLFGEVLNDQIAENLRMSKNETEKQVIRKVVSGQMIRNYRLIGEAQQLISYKMHNKFADNLKFAQYNRKKRNYLLTENLRSQVTEFLERDDNSKMCPGKKDCLTKNKLKKQKRLLLHSLKDLHRKFITEKKMKTSLRTFCRLRPFWVIWPKWSDRETCACIKHANIELITNKLFMKGIMKTKSLETITSSVVCDVSNIDCMFGRCINCREKKICDEKNLDKNLLDEKVEFEQWECVSESRKIKGVEKVIRRTTKSKKVLKIRDLINLYNTQNIPFKKHVFIMKHQMKQMQKCKSDIDYNEIAIQIDFAENYVLKFFSEIQSMHFGASKKQLSLHTGVYYTKNYEKQIIKSFGFCSVSENLDHQSHAIWAHLQAILTKLSQTFPSIQKINFFSDGPTSQYKNRSNIYFLLTRVPNLFKNLKFLSWNYSASGHGKGPMDGIGGALKRNADRSVLQGLDISSASSFVDTMNQSKVEVWEVPYEEIETAKSEIPKKLPSIPAIMEVHQITWAIQNPGYCFLRQVSCFECGFGENCRHFPMKRPNVKFLDTTTVEESSSSKGQGSEVGNKFAKKFKNDYVEVGLCFICTYNFSHKNQGVKCLRCPRVYHFECVVKYNLTINTNHELLCKSCVNKC